MSSLSPMVYEERLVVTSRRILAEGLVELDQVAFMAFKLLSTLRI